MVFKSNLITRVMKRNRNRKLAVACNDLYVRQIKISGYIPNNLYRGKTCFVNIHQDILQNFPLHFTLNDET